MFCKNCGNEVKEGAAFCPKCGNPIGKLPAQPGSGTVGGQGGTGAGAGSSDVPPVFQAGPGVSSVPPEPSMADKAGELAEKGVNGLKNMFNTVTDKINSATSGGNSSDRYESNRYDDSRQSDRYDSNRYDDGRQPEQNGSSKYEDERRYDRSESDRYDDSRQSDRYDSNRYDNGRPYGGNGPQRGDLPYNYGYAPIKDYNPHFDYKPIRMWGYFGYDLLILLLGLIPIIGWIIGLVMLLVWSFSTSGNINRRNYARSKFCWFIILIIVILIVAAVVGGGLFGWIGKLGRIF